MIESFVVFASRFIGVLYSTSWRTFVSVAFILSSGALAVLPHPAIAASYAAPDDVAKSASARPLLWRHHDNLNYVWSMNVDRAAAVVGLPSVAGANWIVAGMGDLDGNGSLDIIWFETTTGRVFAWYMNGTDVGSVAQLGAVYPGGQGASGWMPEAVADFNDDGIPDILWRHQTLGSIYIWYFQPDGTYVLSDLIGALDAATASVGGVGDFNGDGYADIVWTLKKDYSIEFPAGMAVMWQTLPKGALAFNYGPNGNKVVVKVADFDGDGKADLLWTDPATGATEVWYMDGGTVSAVDVMPAIPVGYQASATLDCDHNGTTDIVWFDQTTGLVAQWLMMGRGNAPVQNSLGFVGPTWFVPNQ